MACEFKKGVKALFKQLLLTLQPVAQSSDRFDAR